MLSSQKWIPFIICCKAIASGDSCGLLTLPVFSPCAAELSGNIRNAVFMTICATRGIKECSNSPLTPKRVAMRTGLAMQAYATISAASSGLSVGTLL